MTFQHSVLITGSPTAKHKNKGYKPAQIRFHSDRPHTITKINDNINMGSTKAWSVNAVAN